MKWTSDSKVGFRLSIVDMLFILIGAAVFMFNPFKLFLSNGFDEFMRYLVPFIVLNFFLFCNVFRVRRSFEIIWVAIAFVVCFMCLTAFEQPRFEMFFVVQSVLSAIVILQETQLDDYRGIFSKYSSLVESIQS